MKTTEMLKVEIIDLSGIEAKKGPRYHDDNLPVVTEEICSKIGPQGKESVRTDKGSNEMEITHSLGVINYVLLMTLSSFISPALKIVLDIRQTLREIPYYKILNFVLKYIYSVVYAFQHPGNPARARRGKRAFERYLAGSAV
ncbi:MAG: hypothetical protein OEY64_05085 [Nitrospinota bacterium]|nr:hypothetical protein [Nitrospinota bacterium]